jgi:hypothetical protein
MIFSNALHDIAEKKERALYERVEKSLWGAILKLYPQTSAHLAHRRSRSSSRNKLLQCLAKEEL